MPINRRIAVLPAVLRVAASASAPGPKPVAPAAIAGDALPPELGVERQTSLVPSAALTGASDANAARPVVTLIQTRPKLAPQAGVKPFIPSKAEGNPPGTYGGLMAFVPGRSGTDQFGQAPAMYRPTEIAAVLVAGRPRRPAAEHWRLSR